MFSTTRKLFESAIAAKPSRKMCQSIKKALPYAAGITLAAYFVYNAYSSSSEKAAKLQRDIEARNRLLREEQQKKEEEEREKHRKELEELQTRMRLEQENAIEAYKLEQASFLAAQEELNRAAHEALQNAAQAAQQEAEEARVEADRLKRQEEERLLRSQKEQQRLEDLEDEWRHLVPLIHKVRSKQLVRRAILANLTRFLAAYKQETSELCAEAREITDKRPKTLPVKQARAFLKNHDKDHLVCHSRVKELLAGRFFLDNKTYNNKKNENVVQPALAQTKVAPKDVKLPPIFSNSGSTQESLVFVPPSDISDPSKYHRLAEPRQVPIVAREYKYWRLNQVGDPKVFFKPGIRKVSALDFKRVSAEVEFFQNAGVFPVAFLSSNHWTKERQASVEAQLSYVKMREQKMAEGTWKEPTKEEKEAKRANKGKGKQVQSPRGDLHKGLDSSKLPVKSAPPVLVPAHKAESLLKIQKEQQASSSKALNFLSKSPLSSLAPSRASSSGYVTPSDADRSQPSPEALSQLIEEAADRTRELESVCSVSTAKSKTLSKPRK